MRHDYRGNRSMARHAQVRCLFDAAADAAAAATLSANVQAIVTSKTSTA